MPYNPSSPLNVADIDSLRKYVELEFRAIAAELAQMSAVDLRQVGQEPKKPRAGMIASADGVGWNPGAGAGAYEFKGGVWVKL
jgi:hypothetical protein